MNQSASENFARLLDWMEGNLSPEEAQAVVEQLSEADEKSKADLAWLRRFYDASQRITLAPLPPQVRASLVARFREQAEARRQPSLLQRLVATLTFDSGTQMVAVGLRSAASQGLQKQLIYTTEAAEVALNIQPRNRGQSVDVTGQLFPIPPLDPDLFSVQLVQQESEVAITTTDDLGEFSFEAIPIGEYEMVISGQDLEFTIWPLQIQP